VSEKEYIVVLNKGVDFHQFHERMVDFQGEDGIPNRQVEVANERPASTRQANYYLTELEAHVLRPHPDVLAVEIPYWQNPDIEIGPSGVGADPERTYRKYGQIVEFSAGEGYPWQFPQSGGITNKAEPWNVQSDGTFTNNYTGVYAYGADGEGVDIVIQDTGIDAEHYEFQDANGISRVNKIDWATTTGIGTSPSNLNDYYRDWEGHGTHVASTAAGKSMGYARGAQIYAQKLQFGAMLPQFGGLQDYTAYTDCFDQIKIFHRNKAVDSNGNKRPTIVNMSWGSTYTIRSDYISSVNYRGSVYSSAADLRPNNDVLQDHTHRNLHYGISASYINSDTAVSGGTNYSYITSKIPAYSASIVADIEELIDEGVHVVISAGNTNEYIAHDTHVDWNNTITFATPSPAPGTPWPGLTSGTHYLHRGGVHHPEAFIVGNLNLDYRNTFQVGDTGAPSGPKKIGIAASSGRGPGVSLWHPGSQILGASSRSGPYVHTTDPSRTIPENKMIGQGATEITHPLDATEGLLKLSGTSMAAPGVVGILSCILEKNPGLTPAQLKTFVETSSNNATIEGAIQEGYPDDPAYIDGISFAGVPNIGWRSHLPAAGGGLMGGPNRMAYQQYNTVPPSYSISLPSTTLTVGTPTTVTITTTNVADGTILYWEATPTTSFQTTNVASGQVTITSNTGSFTLTAVSSTATQGNLTIRSGSATGTVVASSSFTIAAAPPSYSISLPSTTLTVGTPTTATITTTNVADATILYWAATPTASFQTTNVASGQVTITSNTGSFTLTAVSSTATQGNLTIRSGSATGTVVASSSFTIAAAPPAPPASSSSSGTPTTYVGRPHTTRRSSIVEALVRELKKIDGSADFLTDVFNNVHPRLKFWDEIEEFPAIHLNAGSETREYQAAGYRDRYLTITLRCYVQEEDAALALDKLLEDAETILDEQGQLSYTDKQGVAQKTIDIKIVSIETDEGVLEPYGVGEILVQVHY